MDDLPQSGFVRLSKILLHFPVGKSTWWAGIAAGRFPAPVKLGSNTTAWRAQDIWHLIEKVEQGASLPAKSISKAARPMRRTARGER